MSRQSETGMLLDMAAAAATRSTCSRLHVGAVLAAEGRPFATGYNGAPAGLPHCEHADDEPCEVSVHAEANAVANAARHGAATAGATLVSTHAPCRGCAGILINAGVEAVIYAQPYRSDEGLALLVAAGVDVVWQVGTTVTTERTTAGTITARLSLDSAIRTRPTRTTRPSTAPTS